MTANSVPPATLRRAQRGYTLGIVVFVALATSLMLGGQWSWLQAIGLEAMPLPWADARTITGASIALDQGLDPRLQNPGDPWQRPMNYPGVWLLPARLGCRPEHTWLFAWCLLAAFTAGLFALRPLARTRGAAALLLLGVFAPPSWLLLERANNDALMFLLASGAAGLVATRPAVAAAVVAAAGALKLYPIAGLFGLLRDNRRRSLRLVLPVAAGFALYAWWLRADIAQIRTNTMQADWLAYGIETVPRMVAKNTGLPFVPLLAGAALALALLLGVGYRQRLRTRLGAAGSPHVLAAFRIGSATFLASFLIGRSFDYRLVFLLLTLPQLATWSTCSTAPVRRLARAEVVMVLLLSWSMAWRSVLTRAGGGTHVGLVLDEVLAWSTWAGLALLSIATLPDWLVTGRHRGRPFADRTADAVDPIGGFRGQAAVQPPAAAAAAARRAGGA